MVSDNGLPFDSFQFSEFLKNNKIKQVLVPLLHPQSNGAAERSVATVKKGLGKQILANRNIPIK